MADHRAVIDDNIVSLCDYTNCTIRLLEKAREQKILFRDEFHEIERQPQGYDRNRALYDVLRRKGEDVFAKLVLVMEAKETIQSSAVLSILKTVAFKKAKLESTCALVDLRDVIDDNMDTLCDYTECTLRFLDKLTEMKILTMNESLEIERQPHGYRRNIALYEVLRRKSWDAFVKLVYVMETEETKQSNNVLSILKTFTIKKAEKEKMKSKWWPEEKFLVNSFYERKTEQGLLVEQLFKLLTQHVNQPVVISQKVTVSGFGGVGKTTMAKWYARHYEGIYDHIIWIDCGEGSLIKSFVQLSAALKVEQNSESDLTNLARICFQTLEDKKCLFIFDNAERYVGCDGIKDVLPKNEKFHSIITSRNREWGSNSGYGQIQQLALDVFSTGESIRFLRANLKHKSIEETNLKEMCDLLGNLPLALQIATSTLNKHAVGFSDYIKIIQGTNQIIEKTVDDYEKTINTALKSSLDFIEQGKDISSQLAYNFLLVFAYIQPDNIPFSFFQSVELCESWEIQAAMELLETYSLISIKGIMNDNEIIDYECSIHRLLQQVIRFNGKDREETTLKKILSCEVHIDNKLLPYRFANESLKKEFPKLRAELEYQLQLPGLISSREFERARQLSGIIYTESQTSASRFNHAICLKHCRLFEESLSHLRELFSYVSGSDDSDYCEPSELVSLSDEPTKIMVGSQIFIINMLKGDIVEAKETLELIPNIKMPNTEETLSNVIHAIDSKFCGNSGFRLSVTPINIFLKIYTEHDVEDLFISGCKVDDVILQLKNLRDVKLEYAKFTREQSKSLSIGNLFHSKLTNLAIITADFDTDDSETTVGNPMIRLNQLEYLQTLNLMNCKITLTDDPLTMRLNSLVLNNVSFHRNDQILNEVILNELINFSSLKTLNVIRHGTEESDVEMIQLWLVDMTGNLNLDIVRLEGNCVVCQNWEDANWTIDHLILNNVELTSNRMKIKALELEKSRVHLSSLPTTIESLALDYGISIVQSPQDCFLLNLKYLNTRPPFNLKSDILGLLDKCPNLVGLKLDYGNKEYDDFDLCVLPSQVRELHLKGVRITGDEFRHLDKLVFDGYTTDDMRQVLTKLCPEYLCYRYYELIINSRNDTKLVDLIQRQFKSIVLGPITWRNFKTCELSSYVDEERKYYIFQNQWGTSIDLDKFSAYFEFPPIER